MANPDRTGLGRSLRHVVVGMGINVNLDTSLLPEVMVAATSLMTEAADVIAHRTAVRPARRVERRYRALASGWQYEVACTPGDAGYSGARRHPARF